MGRVGFVIANSAFKIKSDPSFLEKGFKVSGVPSNVFLAPFLVYSGSTLKLDLLTVGTANNFTNFFLLIL